MKEKMFICSKIKTETEKEFKDNIIRQWLYSRWAILNGYDPEPAGAKYCMFLDDFSVQERSLGLEFSINRLKDCAKILIVEDGRGISEGMKNEIKIAKEQNITHVAMQHKDIISWLKENDPPSAKIFPEFF